VQEIKKYVAIQKDMFGLCPIQKNGAIQKDLIADNEWSPYKCRFDIFVVWAPLSSLLLTFLFCGRHRTENEQISLWHNNLVDGQRLVCQKKGAKLPIQKKNSEARRENRGKSAPSYEKDRPKGQICSPLQKI
jgi:hypothetical protein